MLLLFIMIVHNNLLLFDKYLFDIIDILWLNIIDI